MVDIQSKEIIDKMSDELKVQPAMQLPRELGKQILPVYNVNPVRNVQIRQASSVVTGTLVMHTTSATKRTFLTSVSLNNQSDVVANNVSIDIIGSALGKQLSDFLSLRKISLTVFRGEAHIVFNPAIEIEKDTNISVRSIFTVGVSVTAATISFYETDPQ